LVMVTYASTGHGSTARCAALQTTVSNSFFSSSHLLINTLAG
jgi:hypothetical protein